MKSTSSAARFFVAYAATVLTSSLVEAWSGGAGTCTVGSEGPAFPGTVDPHKGNGQGELSSGERYKVMLGDKDLAVGAIMDLDAATDYTLTVMRNPDVADTTEFGYKGFLITLQDPGQGEVSGSFMMESKKDPIRILESDADGADATPNEPAKCAMGVSGATHINADLKNTTKLTLNVAEAVNAVKLTITIMEVGDAWYFSTYNMNVVGGAAPATNAPSASPKEGNETSTAEPTAKPTAEPTAAPSSAPNTDGIMSTLAAISVLALTWLFA